MKKRRFLDSIKTKVILAMILLVAVPLIIVTVISAINFMNKGIEDTISINEAQAHIMEQNIQSVLDQNMRALEVLAKAPSTIAYVSGYEAQEEDILDQMKEIDANMGDGNATIITDGEGKQKLRTVGECVDISDREYFLETMEKGTEYVSDIQVSKTDGTRIATFVVPVKDTDGETIGIVQRNYELSDFHDILVDQLMEDKQELVIVDRTGSVVAHSGHEIDPEDPEDQSGNPFYTDSRGEKMTGSYETKWAGDTWMVSWVKEKSSGWVVASCRVQAVAIKAVRQTVIWMVVIGVIFLAVGAGIAIFMSQSFTAPIKNINESLGALADGRFMQIQKFEGRKDEFGEIVEEANTVIRRLSDIVSHIKNSAESVNASSEQLATTTDQITKTAEDVSSAVQEIANGATQQADEIQEALENTAVISKNIQAVSDNADAVAQTASEMNEDSTETAKQLERLKTSAGEMGEAIVEISEKIGATETAVERISTKVAAINSIASQTNLLALNASIEAARAGEAGRGFAVVAEEIGQLADESANAANEIRTEMDLLLQQSQSAVAMAKEINATTEVEQKQIIEDTVASIDKLIQGISSSVDGIGTITESAKGCEESRTVVVDSMNDLSAISEENAAASEETAASMDELGAIVTSLAEDAGSLKEISNALIEDMKFFKD